MMSETRVIPSGKVYRQLFDAQVQLSRTLHDTRRKREGNEWSLYNDNAPVTRDTDTGNGIKTAANHVLADLTIRDQLSSGARYLQETEEQSVEEEVRGLPDTIVVEKLGSDIIERLAEKKAKDHAETLDQLHQDLAVLSMEYESFLREAADDFLRKLSASNEETEKLMRSMGSHAELSTHTLHDLHKLWDAVKQGSEDRRKWIRELDVVLVERESRRTATVAVLLKKCTQTLEKIGHVAAADIHRLIDSEAMMINQATLANRRALARLFLNLTEKDLQGALSHRLHWQEKLQEWKNMKVQASVHRFKEIMSSPQILRPQGVQATLGTLQTEQQSLGQRRLKVLQSFSSMVPPRCSKDLAAEWYSSLSAVNEQIDSLHINSVTKIRLYYEQTWQDCLVEVDKFKEEVSGYGLASDDIQEIVSKELLPVLGQSQCQSEEWIEEIDRAFESLAKRIGALSKGLFGFAQKLAHLWEMHGAGLQRREHQLQDQLEKLSHVHEQENQKKEAELDMMLDRLRQESSEEALRISLSKTLHILEEITNGYNCFHKEDVDSVCRYPAMILKEMQKYSTAVSRFFRVKEIYSQDTEELHGQYPFITLDVKQGSAPEKKRGETHSAEELTSSSSDLLTTEEDSISPEELYDPQVSKTFTTSRGNVYNTQSFRVQWEEEGEQGPTLSEVELVGYPQNLLAEVQRDIRVAFFTHLEDWYETALSNAVKIVVAKRQELKSGLDLRLKLQESRAKRIEEDVHNVRAVELVLHRDHVDRHCKSVQESLKAVRTHVQKLQLQQQEQTENFRAQIYAMENVFTSATKSDKLASLCGSLQSRLEKHMTVVQKTQRSFRLEAESTLGGLREANAQFIKSLRLFSDGGNYTPHEIEVFQKRLEKAAKSIDSTDEAIMLDMEGTESRCLEQAKEVISMFEDKFLCLTLDLRFLEKIQRILTNTQVQIKTEATKSNWQKKHLDNMMMQLESMTEACARPGPEEKTVKVSDVSTLTWSIMEELKNRCQYLECSLDPSASVTRPESPLQGAFAVAARPKSRRQDKPTSPGNDSLLQPSRMGVPLTDDAAVGVVRGLLRLSRPKTTEEIHAVAPERGPAPTMGTQLSTVAAGRQQRAGGTPSTPALDRQRRRSAESVSSQSVLRLSKLTRSEKRFQVFGSNPEEQSAVGFNGFITNILWKANDLLLSVAEDFYKKKDRRPVTRPQHLQETFELCAEDINRRLLIYQTQTREYHNGCLQDFKEQLSRNEELISRVPALLLSHLGEEHLQQLSQATSQIHQSLECAQQESEDRKKEHIGKLRVRLGHPAHEEELNSLRAAEEDRQKEQASAIQRSKQELQACARKHGEEFVTALAAATENLLFQMDNLLTVNEVQDGQTEKKKETLTALIRRKECKVPLQEKDCGSLIQRGSRTWPGVSFFEADGGEAAVRPCKETASITTAKTTLGHLSTCEARDAVYQSYRQRYEEELTRAEEESEAHRKQVERWEQHWRESVKTLLQLYSE